MPWGKLPVSEQFLALARGRNCSLVGRNEQLGDKVGDHGLSLLRH